MDRYVRNFIIMSVVYLGAASVLGIGMMLYDELQSFRFVHSHFMLLGWVSMMIYGVGYHILPKFAGKLLKYPALAEAQFWIANLGLIGMAVFYTMMQGDSDNPVYRLFVAISGALQVGSSLLFFYNMFTVLFSKPEQSA